MLNAKRLHLKSPHGLSIAICCPDISSPRTSVGGHLSFPSWYHKSRQEHQPELEGAYFRTVFSSPFFLIYKLSVAITGRLTTWFALARASCLTPLRLKPFSHPLTRIVVVPLDIEPFLVFRRKVRSRDSNRMPPGSPRCGFAPLLRSGRRFLLNF